MAMDLREIAAAALDEWEVSQNGEPSVQADAEDLDFKATASKAVRGAKGLFKDMMSGARKSGIGNAGVPKTIGDVQSDLAAHDDQYHPASKGGYQGGECSFRGKMAETIQEMGMTGSMKPEDVDALKKNIGEENWNKGTSAANKNAKQGNVNAELNEIQNLVKEKNREQDPSKKAELQRKLDKARDAYYRRNLRDAEYDAMKEMQQLAAENPESAEKVAAVAEKIAENPKMGEVQKDAARNLIEKTGGAPDYDWDGESGEGAEAAGTSPDDPQVKEAEEKRQQDAETMQEAIRRATAKKDGEGTEETPNETEQSAVSETGEGEEASATAESGTETGTTEETTETTAEEPVRKTRQELADAATEAEKAYRDAVTNGASEEEIDAAQKAMEDAQKAVEERNAMPDRQDLLEDLTSAEKEREVAKAYLDDLTTIDPATGKTKGSDKEIKDAEQALADAEENVSSARDAFNHYKKPTADTSEKNNQGSEGAEQGATSGTGKKEFNVRGKTYVDLSNMGFFEGMGAAFKAGWEGKDIVTEWDKMSGRWDKITASDPKFKASMNALKGGVTKNWTETKFGQMIKANVDNKNLSEDERMVASAVADALEGGMSVDKALALYNKQMEGIEKRRHAAGKADDAHKAAEGKESRAASEEARKAEKHKNAESRAARAALMKDLDHGIAPEGVTLSPADEAYRARKEQELNNKYKASNVALAKSGVLPDGIDPADPKNKEIVELAAQQKKKMADAAEKASIALDNTKAEQLTKTVAEDNAALMQKMNETVANMEKAGDAANLDRAARIKAVMETLQKTHSRKTAKSALEEFNRIIGVDEKKGNGNIASANEEWTYVPDGDATHQAGSCTLAPKISKAATLDSVPDIGGSAVAGTDKQTGVQNISDTISNEFQGLQQCIGSFDPKNVKETNSESIFFAPINRNLPRGPQGISELQKALRRKLDPQTVVRENGKNLEIIVPNKTAGTISFKKMLDSQKWKDIVNNEGGLQAAVGENDDGSIAHINLADPNTSSVFVVGRSGMGKTQGLQSMMNSMMVTYGPDEVQFDIIDPKGVDFSSYKGMKDGHVRSVVPASKAKDKLLWYVNEMESRYSHLDKNRAKDLLAYNAKVGDGVDSNGNKLKMPHLVLTCDEIADLRSAGDPDVDNLLARLAAKGRAAGIHLMLGTQRADRTHSLPGFIQGNIGQRIIFGTESQIDSRLATGLTGSDKSAVPAHEVTSPGTFYIGMSGNAKSFKKGRGAFMGKNNEVTEAIADQYKGNGTPTTNTTTPPTTPPAGGGGGGNPPPNNGNTTPTQNNTTASTQNTQPQNANHQSIVHPDAVTGTSIASANDQSPNPDFNKIHYSKDNRLVMDGERQMLRRWEDNYDSKFEDARKFGSDAIATHGMRKFGSMNSVVKDLFSLIKKGGIDKTRNNIGGLYTAPLTMDPREGAYYGIGGPSSVRNESPFLLLAKDGKDLDDSDNIGGILVNPAVVDICEALKAPCPDYVEKLAAEIHKVRPDIFVMPYTKVVDMTRAIKGGHEHSANRNASQSPAQPAKPQKAEPAQQVTTADPAVQTNLTPQQVKTAEAANKAVNVGVENFRNKHQPKGAAQKAEFDKVIGSDDGWAE